MPDDALRVFRSSGDRGAELEATWQRGLDAYASRHADEAGSFHRALAGELPDGWQSHLPAFTPADGDMATRDAGGATLAALAAVVTNIVGGSADLNPSTRTAMKDRGDFESPQRPRSDDGPEDPGERRRRVELRRTQHPLRRSRARHGRGADGDGGTRRARAVRRHLLVVLGLHAPEPASRGSQPGARDLRVHARQSGAGRGRPDTPAGRASGQPACDTQHDGGAAERRHRDRRSVARGVGSTRAARWR